MVQNTQEIKTRIIEILEKKGPSLPVHIAKESEQSILFTSAFLSELMAEKRIKQSNMRIGSSPLYFLPGQEPQLEKSQDHIKGKEKEALVLIKEKRILKDIEQNPPIRVALRSIKDFAIPFNQGEELYWRYFIENQPLEPIEKEKIQIKEEPKEIENKEDSKDLNIFEKEKPLKKTVKKKTIKKTAKKQDEKFFNKVKEFLNQNEIELLEIEGFNKNSVTLRIKKQGKELLLVAYNRKKITEKEFIEANKQAKEKGLKYIIINTGELTKKLSGFIEAIQNIYEIQVLE